MESQLVLRMLARLIIIWVPWAGISGTWMTIRFEVGAKDLGGFSSREEIQWGVFEAFGFEFGLWRAAAEGNEWKTKGMRH